MPSMISLTRFEGPHGVDVERTVEDITIAMDSVGGSDNANGLHYNTQAQFTALGAFKTIPAVIEALPNRIAHDITLEFPDGIFALSADAFGNFDRFSFEGNPAIYFQSANGLVRETATTTYAVSAASSKREVVLQADPGFSANDHRGKYLRVISGTGAGQYKPIRSHSGVNWPTAGRWSPILNATSVVEILVPAATLQSPLFDTVIETRPVRSFERNIIFEAIDVTSTEAFAKLTLRGAFVRLDDGARLLDMGMTIYGGGVNLGDCVVYVNLSSTGIAVLGGYVRSSSGAKAWLISGARIAGISLLSLGPQGGSTAFIWEGAIDDTDYLNAGNPGHAIRLLGGNVHMSWASDAVQGADNDGFGVYLDNGASLTGVDSAKVVAESDTLTGTFGDLGIEGVAKTWSDLDGAVNKQLTSGVGSFVAEG